MNTRRPSFLLLGLVFTLAGPVSPAHAILDDEIVGAVGGLSGNNNFFDVGVATVGTGIEFTGEGLADVVFEADLSADTLTIRMSNNRTGPVGLSQLRWQFDDLQWRPQPRFITSVFTLADTFPAGAFAEFFQTPSGSGTTRLTIKQPGNTGLLHAGEMLEATYRIVTAALVFGINGDLDDSGQVEQGDLDLVLQNWGRDTVADGVPAGWVNFLPEGQIDQAELDRVLQNWGNTSAPNLTATPGTPGTPVPEPAAAALLGIGALATPALRRRR